MLSVALVVLVLVLVLKIMEARWSKRMRGGCPPVEEATREMRTSQGLRLNGHRPSRSRPNASA